MISRHRDTTTWRLASRGVALVAACAVMASWCAAHAAPALAFAGQLSGVEGTTIGGPTDPDPLGSFGYDGYAVIDWGDGRSDTCHQATGQLPQTESFCYWQLINEFSGGLWGWHNYHLAGHYTITITQYDDDGNVVAGPDYGNAYVSDAPLTPQGTTSSTLVGASSSAVVGRFTDGNSYATDPHAYSAAINWGDGSPIDTSTTITGTGGSGGFTVSGTHAYTSPSPAGGYSVTVSIADEQGSTATISSHVSATLSGAQSFVLQEGSFFTGVLAQFCGTSQPVTSATVDWGDGSGADTRTTVQQTSNNGSTCYQVLGTHIYTTAAAQPFLTTITPDGSSGAASVTGSVTVTDAPLSSSIDANFLAANSLSISQSVIAHVTDADPVAPTCAPGGACDLTAEINWGDGSAVQAATLTPDPNGGLDVVGGPHQYPAPGSYTVTVTATDSGGASTTASGTYKVSPPPQQQLGCESPVPAAGATSGLYGARLAAGTHPNWGISPDDRVLRFGNLVLCAVDAPWVYEGPSTTAQLGGLGVNGSAGAFQTKGKVIVNGLELDPHDDESAFTVDTSNGQITGPVEEVQLSKEALAEYPDPAGLLGSVNLRSNPWTLQGQTLAYLPATAGDSGEADGRRLDGTLRVDVDGLGTVTVIGNEEFPDAFSLQAYAGGPVTGTVGLPDEYPGLLGGPVASVRGRDGRQEERRVHRGLARPHRPELAAHADGSGCNYPPAPADSPVDLTSDDLFLGGVDMHCAYLFANPSTGTAQGGGGFGIGDVYVNGYFGFNNGKFADAGGGADNINAEVFPGLTLNSIHFGVFLNPTRFHATSTFQVGEGLANLTGGTLTAFATGGHKYSYDQDKPITGTDDLPGTTSVIANPFSSTTIGIGAEYSPLGLIDVHGYVLYEFPGYIELGGHLGYDIGIVSAEGNIQGQFWLPRSFDIEGNLSMCFTELCATAHGLVSSRGLTGCWDVKVDYVFGHATFSAGGSYRWGASLPDVYIPPFTSGCDAHLGDYRVTASSAAARDRGSGAHAAAASGSQTFRLGPGLHSVMVRVAGSGDAPAFTLSGPHAVKDATGDENTLTGAGTVGTYRSQQAAITWIAIAHPGAGTWTITPQPGSVPITSVAVADYTPGSSVHASVEGRGYHRTLQYTLRPQPGQTVRFVESGKDVTRSIATTSAARGAIQFTPAIGPPGRRRIIAQVSRNGLLAAQYVVASYVAPGPPRAARPRHLQLTRRGSQLMISWAAAANATEGYQVVMIATDGRRQLFQPKPGQLSVIVPSFSSAGAKVMVEGVGPDGRTGYPANATLKPLGPPARIKGLKIIRSGKTGVQISWGPAPRASAYLIAVTLTNVKRPALILTRKRVLRFVLKRANIGVTVVVQGQGAMDALGPKASARLTARRPVRKTKPKKSKH